MSALRLYKEEVRGSCVWILVDKVKWQINIIQESLVELGTNVSKMKSCPLKLKNVVTKLKATNTF